MTVDETLDLIADWQMARVKENEMIKKIIATNDLEFIKSFIENDDIRIEANIQPRRLIRLILATKDIGYIKSLIEDSQKRKKLGVDVMTLIEETDVEYKKELALNAQKREEFGIETSNALIIGSTEDAGFIKSFIEDEQKRKAEKLGSLEIRYLLESTDDIEYIRNIVEDERKIKELALNESDVITLKREFDLEEKPKSQIGLNDIGKKVFVGENAITGVEYASGVKIVQKEMEKSDLSKELSD